MVIADNQREIVDMLSSEGYITNLGWYSEFSDRKVLDSLKLLCKDYDRRVSVSREMQKLVDGEGVATVEEIMKITS